MELSRCDVRVTGRLVQRHEREPGSVWRNDIALEAEASHRGPAGHGQDLIESTLPSVERVVAQPKGARLKTR
jgi:hypothetical protein